MISNFREEDKQLLLQITEEIDHHRSRKIKEENGL